MSSNTIQVAKKLPSFQASADVEHPSQTAITKTNRRLQLIKLLAIASVSIVTVVLTIIDVVYTAKDFERNAQLIEKVQGSVDTAFVIHYLQQERGLTALQFGHHELDLEKLRVKIEKMRKKVNQSINVLEERHDTDLNIIIGGKPSFWVTLENFRSKIDKGKSNIIEHLHRYRKWVSSLIFTLADYTKTENLQDYANLVYSYEMVILSKEEVAMERALGGMKFIDGHYISARNNTWYNEKRALAENYLKTAFLFSSELKNTYFLLLRDDAHLIEKIDEKRAMLANGIYTKSEKAAYEWFSLMTRYNNLLLQLQIHQADLIEAKVNEQINRGTKQLVIRSLLLCFTLVVVPCIIVSLARVQRKFYEYTLMLFGNVGLEQARTDFLMRENARHVDNLAERWKSFSRNSVAAEGRTASTSNGIINQGLQ